MNRYSLFISFVKNEGKPNATVEVRRVSVAAKDDEQAIDIGAGIAIILSRHGHLGMVDSVDCHGPDEVFENPYPGDVTLEQAIVWAVTVGMPDCD